MNKRNITVKAAFPYIPANYANCPDSLSRNKAKNALSLARSISPDLTGAKIGKKTIDWLDKDKKIILVQ